MKKELEQVREALVKSCDYVTASSNAKFLTGWGDQLEDIETAISTIDKLIAEQGQEPVAWQLRTRIDKKDWTSWKECRDRSLDEPLAESSGHLDMEFRPLYAAPQPASQTDDARTYMEGYSDGKAWARDQSTPGNASTQPVAMKWLAEMIMSDCGCSTNNESLLDRIVTRIDKYERANTPA